MKANTTPTPQSELIKNALKAKATYEDILSETQSDNIKGFHALSANHVEIDVLGAKNDTILASLIVDFQDTLNVLKNDTETTKTNKEYIRDTFNLIESKQGEDFHKKAKAVFNAFKWYYNSNFFIPKSLMSFEVLKALKKASKFITKLCLTRLLRLIK